MTTTNTKNNTATDYNSKADIEATSKVTLGIVAGLGGAAGIWSIACLASALTQNGFGGVITSYLKAIGTM